MTKRKPRTSIHGYTLERLEQIQQVIILRELRLIERELLRRQTFAADLTKALEKALARRNA